jgi:uncharacterized protein
MASEFTWNIAKATSNLMKHRVAFEDATLVFADPYKLQELDRHVDGEARWQTLGMVEGELLLLVAHTDWEEGELEIIRLISARPATAKERRRYEQSRYSILY